MEKNTDYLIGLLITALVGSAASAFGPTSNQLSPLLDILLTAVGAVLLSCLIAGTVRGIYWLFTKNFNLQKFMRLTVIICFTWALTAIISTIKNIR